MAFQRGASSTTSATYVTSTVPSYTSSPYVLITYYGWVYTKFGGCSPSSGNVLLIVHILIENHGYDRVPIASTTLGNPYPYYFYVGISNQQFDVISPSCTLSNETLPMTDVINGLSVKGFVTYEVPANFGSYILIYQPPGNYKIQYVDLGLKTATT